MKSFMKPIVEQWPLMLAYIVLIGWSSVTKNPIPRWMLIFLHAYMLAAVVTFSKSKVVKALAYIVIYVLFTTEITLEWIFGMNISPNVIMLFVETNARESKEFLESMLDKPQLWQVPLCVAGMIVLNIIVEKNRLRVNQWCKGPKTTKVLRGIAIILLVGGVIFSYNYVKLFLCDEMNEVDEWRSHMRNPDDLVTKVVVSFYDMSIAEKEMSRVITLAEQVEVLPQSASNDSLNVIVVIGESYIREHAALYGYPLQTTPFLSHEQKEGRLFVFTDMVSPYNQTTRVIRNLLSCNSLGHHEDWSSAPPFTAIYKKNGYHVTMYDNQKNFDMGFVFAYSLNTYLYHPQIMKACYHETNDSTFEFDGQMVDDYQKRQTPSAKRLVLFHLLGQHVGFEYRYPKNFAYFNEDSLSFRKEPWLTKDMREDIVHYDNATRYNDHVLQQIIGLYDQQNTIVVYLSDHGEEVYDYRANSGRDDWGMGSDPRQVLRWQYMVPFVVWCSDKYAATHPDIIKQLQNATSRPAMLDNVCQLLFHLSDLKTPYYNKTRDVLSSDYVCPKRILNESIDCDSLLQSSSKDMTE
ncbi:MAG: phosphoethanolamine transferase [Prevotella sp.]|nr:phosphoethanolamine transferase [Prevotella sp.]